MKTLLSLIALSLLPPPCVGDEKADSGRLPIPRPLGPILPSALRRLRPPPIVHSHQLRLPLHIDPRAVAFDGSDHGVPGSFGQPPWAGDSSIWSRLNINGRVDNFMLNDGLQSRWWLESEWRSDFQTFELKKQFGYPKLDFEEKYFAPYFGKVDVCEFALFHCQSGIPGYGYAGIAVRLTESVAGLGDGIAVEQDDGLFGVVWTLGLDRFNPRIVIEDGVGQVVAPPATWQRMGGIGAAKRAIGFRPLRAWVPFKIGVFIVPWTNLWAHVPIKVWVLHLGFWQLVWSLTLGWFLAISYGSCGSEVRVKINKPSKLAKATEDVLRLFYTTKPPSPSLMGKEKI